MKSHEYFLNSSANLEVKQETTKAGMAAWTAKYISIITKL